MTLPFGGFSLSGIGTATLSAIIIHHVLRLGTVAFRRQRKAGSRASAIPGN